MEKSRMNLPKGPDTLCFDKDEFMKWLPPGEDSSVSPAMAHLKHQSTASSLLDHRGGPDQSPNRDSSSDYMNNTSEEKDYNLGLPEEEEGITCYIHYCPKDDSYLQGGCGGVDGAGAQDSPKACPPTEAGRGPSRHRCRPKHKGRPKSLNLPPEAKHPADVQRSFKTKTRTSEE
ncbi:unnamed protein product [Rangifer tarandus platyrhynchus]|uniref:Uncharacterized protein n=1 Tax=Rangifer tarandus platyrhynchus TaxID=3082113 RepID=A0ABN8Y2Y2_RANTA|nr:unnamed protein product [Rangifer tarandus platyrhynchus]